MKIGRINIHLPVLLAPMAGYTDYPFRLLCKKMGAGLVYSEFVSADGIIRENARTIEMIEFTEDERPIGIQIFGNDPNTMAKAALFVYNQFNWFDLRVNKFRSKLLSHLPTVKKLADIYPM